MCSRSSKEFDFHVSLEELGFVSKFKSGTIKITKGYLVVMKGVKQRRLYVLQGSTITNDVVIVIPNIQDKTDLWPKRLGHISERGWRY